MLSLHHILALGLFATTLVSCERSSRNVDVQPTTNNKLPNSNGDGKGGTLPDSGTPNTPGGTPNTPGGTPNTPGGTPTPTPFTGRWKLKHRALTK